MTATEKHAYLIIAHNEPDVLVSTDALFARKFSSADFSVIEAIERHVLPA